MVCKVFNVTFDLFFVSLCLYDLSNVPFLIFALSFCTYILKWKECISLFWLVNDEVMTKKTKQEDAQETKSTTYNRPEFVFGGGGGSQDNGVRYINHTLSFSSVLPLGDVLHCCHLGNLGRDRVDFTSSPSFFSPQKFKKTTTLLFSEWRTTIKTVLKSFFGFLKHSNSNVSWWILSLTRRYGTFKRYSFLFSILLFNIWV